MRWLAALIGLGLLTLAGAGLAQGLSRLGAARQAHLSAEAIGLERQAEALRERIAFWQATGAALVPPEGIAQRDSDETEATLAVQKALVELGAETGLALSTFGAAPPPDGLGLPVVAVELEAEGALDEVARFLAGLETVAPRLAVSQLTIRAAGRSGGRNAREPARVAMWLVAWGFWLAAEEG